MIAGACNHVDGNHIPGIGRTETTFERKKVRRFPVTLLAQLCVGRSNGRRRPYDAACVRATAKCRQGSGRDIAEEAPLSANKSILTKHTATM